MKLTKFFIILLVFSLILPMLVACDSAPTNYSISDNHSDDDDDDSCSHSWSKSSCDEPKVCSKCSETKGSAAGHNWAEATCEAPKTCSDCGETSGDALGHTDITGTCSRCNKDLGSWKLGEFVDEFKKPTGNKYISTMVDGKFSNSATTNSTLTAALQITSEDVAIMLWEYGSYLVKCSYGSDNYSIIMLDTNDNKHTLYGTMREGTTRIYLNSASKAKVLSALNKTGSVSFYVVLSDRTTTNYLFTVETSNFKAVYNAMIT